MHQLRYHSAPSSSPAAPSAGGTEPARPAPAPGGWQPPSPEQGRSRSRNLRSGAIAPLALAVVALLSGGAFAATRTRPAAVAAAPTLAELQAAVHRAVPTVNDLPGGWTVDPPDTDTDTDSADDRALAECMGSTYEDSATEAEASFTSGGLNTAAEFTIASSAERARADFAALAGPAAPGCFEQMVRKVLDADKPAGGSFDIAVTPSALAAGLPRDADHDAIGLRVVANLRGPKATVPITFEMVMFRYDRIEGTLMFTGIGSPAFPSDVARSLTDAVVHRLPDPA